ncbi:MAG: histidinol-phosphate transaminase [Actinomycetota bacterium]
MSFRPPVRDDLAELPGYHSPQIDVTHRLNTNESPEPPPPGFQQAVAEQVAALDWNRYPDRSASMLRERLAEHHHADNPAIGADNVFVANGSNEVLQTILLAWGGPGRSVLTFEPTYAMHGQIARVTGTRVVEVERLDDFTIDADSAIATIEAEKPIVTFLCSPNNPTGLIEPVELVERVLETVRPFGLLVVDEAYAQFSTWSALSMFDEDAPLIVTRTFSKTWAMAAARLGYLVAPAWVTERLHTAILPYHLDAVSQIAGTTALDFEDEMHTRVARLVEQRGAIQAGLADLGVEYWPSNSNFVLFRPPGSGADIWQQLVDAGVLIRNCATWPRLDGCLRITIGSAEENAAFLEALAAILDTSNSA